jgi:hypothetical protein
MNLYVLRYPNETGTPGDLIINRRIFCHTLEDPVRPAGVKIPGETAIPAGKYRVVVSLSNRFQKRLPEIIGVPMFAGIRIHGGVCVQNTEGCILAAYNFWKNTLWGRASDALTKMLDADQGEHWIEIFNCYPYIGTL